MSTLNPKNVFFGVWWRVVRNVGAVSVESAVGIDFLGDVGCREGFGRKAVVGPVNVFERWRRKMKICADEPTKWSAYTLRFLSSRMLRWKPCPITVTPRKNQRPVYADARPQIGDPPQECATRGVFWLAAADGGVA